MAADIDGRALQTAYALPRNALRGSNEVYVAERDGTLSVREVTVVDSSAERVVVTSGVSAGDRVVVSPLRGAAEGMLVRALDRDGNLLDPEPETDTDDEADTEGAMVEQTTASRAN